MRCAVVGHVEWVEFVLVDQVPAPGLVAHGEEILAEPAGGGAVAAVQLARLAGRCDFFTALGEDDLGDRSLARLDELGVSVHAQRFGRTRRAITLVDAARERTITTIGPKLRPHGPLPLAGYDAIFFVAGDAEALASAREARFLAATPREIETLRRAGVALDLVVGSGLDPGEHYPGGLDAALVVATEGAAGGVAAGRRYPAATAPGALAPPMIRGATMATTLSTIP